MATECEYNQKLNLNDFNEFSPETTIKSLAEHFSLPFHAVMSCVAKVVALHHMLLRNRIQFMFSFTADEVMFSFTHKWLLVVTRQHKIWMIDMVHIEQRRRKNTFI